MVRVFDSDGWLVVKFAASQVVEVNVLASEASHEVQFKLKPETGCCKRLCGGSSSALTVDVWFARREARDHAVTLLQARFLVGMSCPHHVCICSLLLCVNVIVVRQFRCCSS